MAPSPLETIKIVSTTVVSIISVFSVVYITLNLHFYAQHLLPIHSQENGGLPTSLDTIKDRELLTSGILQPKKLWHLSPNTSNQRLSQRQDSCSKFCKEHLLSVTSIGCRPRHLSGCTQYESRGKIFVYIQIHQFCTPNFLLNDIWHKSSITYQFDK